MDVLATAAIVLVVVDVPVTAAIEAVVVVVVDVPVTVVFAEVVRVVGTGVPLLVSS